MLNPIKNFLDENNISLEVEDVITLEQMSAEIEALEDFDLEEFEAELEASIEGRAELTTLALMVGGIIFIALVVSAFIKKAEARASATTVRFSYTRKAAKDYNSAASDFSAGMRDLERELQKAVSDANLLRQFYGKRDNFYKAFLPLVNPLCIDPSQLKANTTDITGVHIRDFEAYATKAVPVLLQNIEKRVEEVVDGERKMQRIENPNEYVRRLEPKAVGLVAGCFSVIAAGGAIRKATDVKEVVAAITKATNETKSAELIGNVLVKSEFEKRGVENILNMFEASVDGLGNVVSKANKQVSNSLNALQKRAKILDKELEEMTKEAEVIIEGDVTGREVVAIEDASKTPSKEEIDKIRKRLSGVFNNACLIVTQVGNIHMSIVNFQFQRSVTTLGDAIDKGRSVVKMLNNPANKKLAMAALEGKTQNVEKSLKKLESLKVKMDRVKSKFSL